MGESSETITFDCYGTLVDWESGIDGAFKRAAPELGVEIERDVLLRLHAEIEPQLQAGAYRRYRDVLAETARRILQRYGVQAGPEQTAFLAESLPRWPPFRDTRPALGRLRAAGYRLGILSNVDDDLLDGTIRELGVEFDLRVTAEEVHGYKPAPGHFLMARRKIGRGGWTHAAQSLYHDVRPARELTVPVVWINRKREVTPPGYEDVTQFRHLGEFADHMLLGRPVGA